MYKNKNQLKEGNELKNPTWDREEVVLLVTLFFLLKNNMADKEKVNNTLSQLSSFLNKRAVLLGNNVDETFRNYTGVNMKFSNIYYIVSNGKKGLSSFSSLDKEVVEEYMSDSTKIEKEAAMICKKYELEWNLLYSYIVKGENMEKEIDVTTEKKCKLINELKKLKKSSYYAIDNEDSFSDYKSYMHIHRKIEEDLLGIIRQANALDHKALILICGNVGDGKSHLISWLKNMHEAELSCYTIHNDATESRSRYRDEKQELAKVLDSFKDSNINDESRKDKVIVAINLGVLSNFIESEQGKEFSILSNYIQENKILIDTDIYDVPDKKGFFFHVNFGDYHIYRLSNGNADSPYISEAMNKIFSVGDNNPFYKQYMSCKDCAYSYKCPVKFNYELLRKEEIRNGIINILIETIVKDKLIVSTRDLFSFIYDITVPADFDFDQMSNQNKESELSMCLDGSVFSLMFDHSDISILISHIKKYDPINVRTIELDGLITRYNNSSDLSRFFAEKVLSFSIMSYLINNAVETKDKISAELKVKIFNLYARLLIVLNEEGLRTIDKEYLSFIADLYSYIKRDKQSLKNLYKCVIKCVYAWKGSPDQQNLVLNNYNGDYIISTELDLEPQLKDFSQKLEANEFERFPAYINIKLKRKKQDSDGELLTIDYELYKMLKSVELGYRPTAKDNNYYINFITFINKLSSLSEYRNEINIKKVMPDDTKIYSLQKNEFGYSFSEVE